MSAVLACDCRAGADEWSAASYAAATAFSAEVRHEEGPGLLPSDRLYVTASTNKYALLIPAGFKLQARNDRTITLSAGGSGIQISFRIAGMLPSDGSELNVDAYAARLLEEHPGAKIVKTFSASADSRSGPAFELGIPGPSNLWQRGIVAFVPSRSCVVEFSVICNGEHFEAARHHLSTVMLTFRASDAHGELHITPLSDKI